jgi:hypothetical protein
MAKQIINIGTSPNKGDGDVLRTAFSKINDNFTELYAATAADVQIPTQTNNGGKYLTTNGSTLSWGTIPSVPTDVSDLTDTTNIIPADISNLTDTTNIIPAELTDLGITDGSPGQVLTTNGAGEFTFTTVSGGGGATEANFEIKTSNFTAVAGHRYGVNTTAGAVTATLPEFPVTGDAIYFVDSHGTVGVDTELKIDGNGQNIMGIAGLRTFDGANVHVGVFYNGTEWRYYA